MNSKLTKRFTTTCKGSPQQCYALRYKTHCYVIFIISVSQQSFVVNVVNVQFLFLFLFRYLGWSVGRKDASTKGFTIDQ